MRGRMLLGGLPFIGAAFGRKCKAVLLGSDLLSSCAHFGALGLEAHRAALWQHWKPCQSLLRSADETHILGSEVDASVASAKKAAQETALTVT